MQEITYKMRVKTPFKIPHHFFVILVIFSFMAIPTAIADITGYAMVQKDGSLRMSRGIIRLYGIYIPFTETTCRSFLQPRRCMPQAALALDFKIQGFIHCKEQGINQDGSISAICHANYTSVSMGEDLASYLLRQGWALALPYAPFEYHALERIARYKGFGIWGFPDTIIR
ncbi:hypothetical protein Noc_1653 [Nitrosococcus oceani ATCC 19707]|uniref:Nuclease (SNase-like) n=2 Tax=Nitrosococcus oceani TaxID=1229 RepID=Q3JAM1_NITOC|nr:hypothetical protein [Nitrosococcus oceani]ABA58125.1 hypothetical protein Noc_1653 [Nitrosococcus oceani ATCC 19707]